MGVIRTTTSFADGVMGELVMRAAGIANEGSRGHRCRASAGLISAPRLMLARRKTSGRMPASRSRKKWAGSVDGLGSTAMVSEDALTGNGHGLGAVAHVELGVQVAQLGLYGVFTDIEVGAKFAVRHPGREQG
jgi:hypothetical protein